MATPPPSTWRLQEQALNMSDDHEPRQLLATGTSTRSTIHASPVTSNFKVVDLRWD